MGAASVTTTRRQWQPFAVGALAIGLVAGFGIGALLFLAIVMEWPIGAWWPAMVQAHGHAQLFGFAGLLVLGVAFHFLPRLRGTPLAGQRYVPWVLWLYGGGVLLRVFGQSLAPLGWGPVPLIGWSSGLSGPLTLAGALLGIGLLVQTARNGPPLVGRAGLIQVLPLLVVGFGSFIGALCLNAYGTLAASLTTPDALEDAPVWLVSPEIDGAIVRLALLGWLVPICVAFSARNFPLFIWARLPSARQLRWGLSLLLAGLLLDLPPAIAFFDPALTGELGRGLQGAALLWFAVTVGALSPKQPPKGTMHDPREAALANVSASPLIGAYVWLVVGGVIMLLRLVALTGILPAPPIDAERHALGTGFVFLLIVGMAVRLLPGFAGVRHRDISLGAAQVAIWAAHLAAVLRVGPMLLNWLVSLVGQESLPGTTMLLTLAGVAGMVAIGSLVIALKPALR